MGICLSDVFFAGSSALNCVISRCTYKVCQNIYDHGGKKLIPCEEEELEMIERCPVSHKYCSMMTLTYRNQTEPIKIRFGDMDMFLGTTTKPESRPCGHVHGCAMACTDMTENVSSNIAMTTTCCSTNLCNERPLTIDAGNALTLKRPRQAKVFRSSGTAVEASPILVLLSFASLEYVFSVYSG
ncbi:hypothetical protein LSAT2_000992 [Lamellibrachia satsuma]|nr:hypothetical protein LSAT2_000992 [Lamellibrachia satsuma]